MKWNDLTKEQQEFLLELDREYPMPEGATHFDMDDVDSSSWLNYDYAENSEELSFWHLGEWNEYDPCLTERKLHVRIPDKPWSCQDDNYPEDVSLTKQPVSDMVKKPNHYQLLPEYEVKDVIKALLDKIEASDFDMTYYEAGFFQQSMQYFMRFYAKNELEDLKKGVETMQFVINSMEERS